MHARARGGGGRHGPGRTCRERWPWFTPRVSGTTPVSNAPGGAAQLPSAADPVVGRRHVLRPGQRQVARVAAVVREGVKALTDHPFQGGVHELGEGRATVRRALDFLQKPRDRLRLP